MSAKTKDMYRVLKVFNNNVILVEQNTVEKILYGKALGFGKKVGTYLDEAANIEKIFSIENKKFNEMADSLSGEFVGLCEEMIYMISQEFDEELSERIHISLTDHLAFTVKRLKNKEEIQNPFLIETEILYNKNLQLRKRLLKY